VFDEAETSPVALMAQMRLHLRLQRPIDHVLQHLRICRLKLMRALELRRQRAQRLYCSTPCRCSSRPRPHRLKGQVHSSIYRLPYGATRYLLRFVRQGAPYTTLDLGRAQARRHVRVTGLADETGKEK
jgi:hypothetical protein